MSPGTPLQRSRTESTKSPTKVIKKRNRIPVSCESCRLRKLKCDRQRPCQNCVARESATACVYLVQGSDGSNVISEAAETEDVHSRVNRLEAVVLSLMQKPAESSIAGDSSGSSAAISRLGIESLNNSETSDDVTIDTSLFHGTMESTANGHQYIGESRWDTVLRDIAAVKQYLEKDALGGKPKTQLTEPEVPALLAGVPRAMSRAELLASMPSKLVADLLINRFFETFEPAAPSTYLLHKSTFLKRYAYHWKHLSEMPIMWFGLLYSIYCLALQSYTREGGEPLEFHGVTVETSELYRIRAAQCILASDLSIAATHSIETLALYGIAEYSRLPHGNVGGWMFIGVTVRKALHMGYHRDPKHFTSITPFEGEMRRRLWMAVSQIDLLVSFQVGLPSMIRAKESDVDPPRYIYEEELYEDMFELPPSRSASEPTPISYMITKHHILVIFGKVVQYIQDTMDHSFDRVEELNEELCRARATIPAHLQMQGPNDLNGVPAPVALQKMQLQMFYHSAICVLNRRYLNTNGVDPQFGVARSLCLDSAMDLLSIQALMHSFGSKWYYFSLNTYNFLLAATVVCLVLHKAQESGANFTGSSYTVEGYKVFELFTALEESRRIWTEVIESSRDARKASRVLEFMLEGLKTALYNKGDEGTIDSQAGVGLDGTLSLNWEYWDSFMQGTELDNLDDLLRQ